MRYQSTSTGAIEAIQWLGGKRDGPKIEDLHAMGIPVMGSARGSEPLTTISDGRSHRPLTRGDWLVRLDPRRDQWSVITAERWEALGFETVNEDLEASALPGLSSLTLNRVGYRRHNPETGAWDMRHGGLTVVEMEESGWEPLYTAHSPDRTHG